MGDLSKREAEVIYNLHLITGCTISECKRSYEIAKEYLRIRNCGMGDHPEKASKPELVLKKIESGEE